MPGGLIQLVAFGAQNILLNGNPSVSFFKKVYKTHTNFAMESMKVSFNRNVINFDQSSTLISTIKRNADLVQNIYFSFEIPSIKKVITKNDGGTITGEDFRFVKNLGEAMIENYFIYIGGSMVDNQYGEWLHIWNELSIESSKRYGYDKLIGNIPEIYSPDPFNRLKNGSIQIEKQRLYVPLKFWFNRNPGLALPLIALQYHEVEIHVALRPYKELFTINGIKPTTWNTYFESATLNINPHLEVNYVFLDTYERNYFATNAQDYLIEQTIKIPVLNINKFSITELVLQNPVKEIIWVLKRNDVDESNNWFEYVDFDYTDIREYEQLDGTCACENYKREKEIMVNGKLIFNGIDRFEEKDASYFNLIQPYQHHTVIPKAGIYVYSFSLFPENFQPSGTCNMSRINKIQLQIERIPIPEDELYKYDMFVYVVNYNFLRVTAGLAGLAFSS
ncbi:major capsid protein [Pyramimonas orientalis virus]|uniref:Major capsid protein n=1 Tax=Pyramimonas orientalis virus 01B TaxID=3134525 RepID=A0A7L9AXD4_9VIRU|nr:major capsid protein [Pyramimonas orientalis virus]QOI90199.1 major capsid protein [Pyramimonas orientalis virus]